MITWDACLSVGVEEIDAQHQAIIALLNDLEAKRGSDDPRVAMEALTFLREYVNKHFMLEEELMAKSGYPLYKEHVAIHEGFVNNVIFLEIEREFDVLTSQMIENLLVLLTDWFIRHISGDDMALGAYLRTKD